MVPYHEIDAQAALEWTQSEYTDSSQQPQIHYISLYYTSLVILLVCFGIIEIICSIIIIWNWNAQEGQKDKKTKLYYATLVSNHTANSSFLSMSFSNGMQL